MMGIYQWPMWWLIRLRHQLDSIDLTHIGPVPSAGADGSWGRHRINQLG
ncbi:hypothetical protein [Micromonospora sp. NBC_00421]